MKVDEDVLNKWQSTSLILGQEVASLKEINKDLLNALIDMVAIAQLDKWDQAVSGRQSFLWNAKVAIAKARGE